MTEPADPNAVFSVVDGQSTSNHWPGCGPMNSLIGLAQLREETDVR